MSCPSMSCPYVSARAGSHALTLARVTRPERDKLREVAWAFLVLGATAFGGPAAHIGLMEREFVARRNWLSREEFLDLVGATNLVPGPNSTEMAIHLGLRRAGWPGFWLAGLLFIAPAFALVLLLSWLYAQGRDFPFVRHAFAGALPIVVAIIFQAAYSLGQSALKTRCAQVFAVGALFLSALNINEVAIVFAAALGGLLLAARAATPPDTSPPDTSPPKTENPSSKPENPNLKSACAVLLAAPVLAPKVAGLLWTFLKIGALIYGSGYVLVAFLRADFVERLGWITERQLLDAVAVGQMTPGPLFTSATFVGYQVAGVPGAVAATVGIFAPSFVFVALLHAVLDRVKGSPRARVFLQCVNAASWALIVWVAWQLLRDAVFMPALKSQFWPLILFGVALILLMRKISSLPLILAGAALGAVLRL